MKSKTIYYKSEKGCPFCQQKDGNIVESVPPAMKGLQVECNNCGARGPISLSIDEAKSHWENGWSGVNGGMRIF